MMGFLQAYDIESNCPDKEERIAPDINIHRAPAINAIHQGVGLDQVKEEGASAQRLGETSRNADKSLQMIDDIVSQKDEPLFNDNPQAEAVTYVDDPVDAVDVQDDALDIPCDEPDVDRMMRMIDELEVLTKEMAPERFQVACEVRFM